MSSNNITKSFRVLRCKILWQFSSNSKRSCNLIIISDNWIRYLDLSNFANVIFFRISLFIQTWNDIEKLFPYFFFQVLNLYDVWRKPAVRLICVPYISGKCFSFLSNYYLENFRENWLTIAHLRTNDVKLKSCKNV